jgi:hypothetical protein
MLMEILNRIVLILPALMLGICIGMKIKNE